MNIPDWVIILAAGGLGTLVGGLFLSYAIYKLQKAKEIIFLNQKQLKKYLVIMGIGKTGKPKLLYKVAGGKVITSLGGGPSAGCPNKEACPSKTCPLKADDDEEFLFKKRKGGK